MDPFATVASLTCTNCGDTLDPADATHRCPACDGVLRVTYPYDRLDVSPSTFRLERFEGIARYDPLLPVAAESLVTLGEGATPLVSCPDLADGAGVGSVRLKREGANPTGSVVDRGMAVAISAAVAHGAEEVSLPTTGPGGHSVAAYAARAGLDAHAYVPSRSAFDVKAMTNVHGGEMTVVEGRYDDAVEAFADAAGYSLAPFDSPYRVEGARTLAYELVEQCSWAVPDAVVVPEGHGLTLVGCYRGFHDCLIGNLISELPRLFVAQPSGCAPFVEASAEGTDVGDAVETPDTVCGPLEVPRPDTHGGALALQALSETRGGAVATDDEAAMATATRVASTDGVPTSVSGSVAADAVATLGEEPLADDADVVVVDPVAASAEADLLRSHLMSQGI